MGPTNEVLRQFVGKAVLLGFDSLDYWNQTYNRRAVENEIKKLDADGKRELAEELMAEASEQEAKAPAAEGLMSSRVAGGLLPEDPFLETYLVRPGGATVVALGPDERLTVVDSYGGQVAELTVLSPEGADDAGALGARADAPATVVRELVRNGNGFLRQLAAPGPRPEEALAVRLFEDMSPPGTSQSFRAEREVKVVVAAPAGRIVDGAPPPSELLSRCDGARRGRTGSSSCRRRSPSRGSTCASTRRPRSLRGAARASTSRSSTSRASSAPTSSPSTGDGWRTASSGGSTRP